MSDYWRPFALMLRLFSLLLAGLIAVYPARVDALGNVPNIRLDAVSYALMENRTGTLVKSWNEDQPIQPASLTKLMTAYVLAREIESGKIRLDQTVVISKNAWRKSGSTMFLEAGDQVSVEQLVLGLVVHSGNDASVSIAELVSGDTQTFVDLMNQTAKQLGMNGTNYVNPNGLPDANQYSTARDSAILTRALINNYNEFYQQFYAIKEFSYRGINQLNRNRLLWMDGNYDGVKTGHVESAGYHTIVSAKREDMRFIGVVLGAKSKRARTSEARRLMDWGFRYYRLYEIYKPFSELGRVRVWMGESKMLRVGIAEPLVMVFTREHSYQITPRLRLLVYQRAPIRTGTNMGDLVISLGEEEVMKKQLIALDDVKRGSYVRQIIDWIKLQFLKFNE